MESLTIQARGLGVVGDDRGEIWFVQQIFFPVGGGLVPGPCQCWTVQKLVLQCAKW